MSPLTRRRTLTASRSRARGFSLIEVMVALIAGLIVALGVIGVSREATNTLHEEVRIASAETGLRIAVERLRADLQRASYMSTGNMQGDPLIAHLPGGNNLSNLTVPPTTTMQNLAGIHLYSGGAVATALAPTTTQPTTGTPAAQITPDAIDIGGNFSSTDEFPAFSCGGATVPVVTPPAANPCGGPVICLEMNTPAMWRIRNQPTPATATNATATAALQAAFYPSTSTTAQYMARLTDPSGHYQYVTTCSSGGASTVIGGNVLAGFQVNLTGVTVLTPTSTGGQGGIGGISAGLVVISPVEVAHWDLQPANALGTNYLFGAIGTAATVDPLEFVLTRGYVDLATGAVDPLTLEVVAEYAVDLKFGFTVDESSAATVTPPGNYGAYPLYAYTVDDSTHNAGWASPGVWGHSATPGTAWVPAVGTSIQGQPEPQRIRSVRARIGIRSPFGDRPADITPPTAAGNYLYRYQLLPSGPTAPKLNFARVRENITEVTLSNQARYFW